MREYSLNFSYLIKEMENMKLGTIIECENGNRYKLTDVGIGQRKFSRTDGTTLRFMTYDNLNQMFRICEKAEEDIDIQSIEEINIRPYKSFTDICDYLEEKGNELIKVVKQLDKEIKGNRR